MPLGKERLLRHDNLGQRIGARDERFDLAILDIADQVGENLALQYGATDQAQVLEIQRP